MDECVEEGFDAEVGECASEEDGAEFSGEECLAVERGTSAVEEFEGVAEVFVGARADFIFEGWIVEVAVNDRDAVGSTLRAKVAGYDDDVHPVYGFASFGTNDLTQTTLAISRDDADRFLPLYVDKEFFERHPFISIHPAVEKMVRTFVADARAIDPKFEIFICGEHGGDVYTIGRLHEIGLTGVSMSPGKVYRSIIKARARQVQHPRKSVK